MTVRRLVPTLGLALTFLAQGVGAQDREGLIEQARAEVAGSPVALDFLLLATDPNAGPLDSLWSVGVYDMALQLTNVGETDLASVWLRWVVRHGSEFPIDRVWYQQSVETAYDIAVEAVDSDGGQGIGAETSWGWSSTLDVNASGTLQVTADPGVDLVVTVPGGGTLAAGGSVALPPNTYTIQAEAPGYETLEVSREVLPGVTTVVDFSLPPVLPLAVETSVLASLARISYTRAGQLVCTNGVVVRNDGMVVAPLTAVTGAVDIEIVTSRGTFDDYQIVGQDDARGIAVLRSSDTPDVGTVPTRGTGQAQDYAWTVFQPGCDQPTQARTVLDTWPTNPQSVVGLAAPLPAGATGAPLVTQQGEWLGLVMSGGTVLPASLTDDLVQRFAVLAGGPQVTEGGGFPIWIPIVAVAGGAAAYFLTQGGDPDDDDDDDPMCPGSPGCPTTGGITITFPFPSGSP